MQVKLGRSDLALSFHKVLLYPRYYCFSAQYDCHTNNGFLGSSPGKVGDICSGATLRIRGKDITKVARALRF